jgi:hypothetical protein
MPGRFVAGVAGGRGAEGQSEEVVTFVTDKVSSILARLRWVVLWLAVLPFHRVQDLQKRGKKSVKSAFYFKRKKSILFLLKLQMTALWYHFLPEKYSTGDGIEKRQAPRDSMYTNNSFI